MSKPPSATCAAAALPSALAAAPSSIQAWVVLSTTATAAPAPTAAVPAAPIAPASRSRSLSASAAITRLPSENSALPVFTEASVSMSSTSTEAEPCTPAVPPALRPTPTERIASALLAPTARLSPLRAITPSPIQAAVSLSITTTSAAPPTPAVPPMPTVPTMDSKSVRACACTARLRPARAAPLTP